MYEKVECKLISARLEYTGPKIEYTVDILRFKREIKASSIMIFLSMSICDNNSGEFYIEDNFVMIIKDDSSSKVVDDCNKTLIG